jgi:putative endopeptidase
MSISPETAFSLENFDREVKPGDNFFHHVNGNWLKSQTIPDDYNSWGTFEVLHEENLKKQLELLENIEAKDSDTTLLKTFWDLTENLFENENIDDLNEYTQKMIYDEDNVFYLLGKLGSYQFFPFFSFYNSQDAKNTKINVPHFHAGGLGLPDRDYYLEDSKKEIREKYRDYICKFLEKINLQSLSVDDIYNMEDSFAKVHYTKVEKRDPKKTYHPYTLTELKEEFGEELMDFLEGIGYFAKYSRDNYEHKILLDNPKFYHTFIDFVKSIDKDKLFALMRWKFSNGYGSFYSKDLDDLRFDFYSRTLSGQKKKKELWKRRISMINTYLGELFGKYYTSQYFDESYKKSALTMISYVQRAFEKRLRNLDWLEKETILKALDKFSTFKVKVGYPDIWRNFETLKLDKYSSITQAILFVNIFDFERELEEMYKEPDWNRWEMNPQDINAYYHPLKNEIVFPAGILQPPFFSPQFDAPVNFGGIGAVIAHEITHGFDDQGRKFDKEGNLSDWWSEKDTELFEKNIQKIKEQFSAEKIFGENVNGDLTCGENIADDGGVKISFDAMKLYFKEKGRTPSHQGYTPEQRFFLSWAHVWKGLVREEQAKQLIKIDPHSPRILRVNLTLSNFREFFSAFEIDENAKNFKNSREIFNLW